MNKRIRRSTRIEDGHMQVKIPFVGIWHTVKVIEDTCKLYVEARAEEVLEYLEDERYA